jgi:lactate racemase
VERYDQYHCSNPEFIREYRFNYAFHPYHCFSMVACGHIAHMHAAKIYLVGAREPGYARGMEMTPVRTFQEAFADARRYVGAEPRILALPRTFRTAGVHLMMKGDADR